MKERKMRNIANHLLAIGFVFFMFCLNVSLETSLPVRVVIGFLTLILLFSGFGIHAFFDFQKLRRKNNVTN